MFETGLTLGSFLFLAVHFSAVVSCILIRRCDGLSCRAILQRAFVGLLLVVGLFTMLGLAIGSSSWVISGGTFTLMSVGATFDVGQTSVAGF